MMPLCWLRCEARNHNKVVVASSDVDRGVRDRDGKRTIRRLKKKDGKQESASAGETCTHTLARRVEMLRLKLYWVLCGCRVQRYSTTMLS